MYQKNQILPQFQTNNLFPKALSEYIIKNKPEDVSGNAFILLAEIFNNTSFKDVFDLFKIYRLLPKIL